MSLFVKRKSPGLMREILPKLINWYNVATEYEIVALNPAPINPNLGINIKPKASVNISPMAALMVLYPGLPMPEKNGLRIIDTENESIPSDNAIMISFIGANSGLNNRGKKRFSNKYRMTMLISVIINEIFVRLSVSLEA